MGIFDTLLAPFNTSSQTKAAGDQTAGINAGMNAYNANAQQGRDALTTNYTAGLQPFLQNYAGAKQGTDTLADALGLNGPAGNQRAVAGFQNNPGFKFAQQQGEDQIIANQARTGQLTSGNTNLDLSKWIVNNANQNWNNYVGQLQPYLGAANSAATGIGTLDSNLGNQLNANFTKQGDVAYGGNTSIGNANANADLANVSAGANLWGLGTGLAGLGVKGGGTLGGNLFNKFLST